MSHSNTSSDGTKTTSFLSRIYWFYRRVRYWLLFPLVGFITFIKNLDGLAEERKLFNQRWSDLSKMPIYNWIKILETGDLNFMFKTKGKITERVGEEWLDLQQQYTDEFGLDEQYKQKLRLMKQLNSLNLDFVITKDRSLLNVIRMVEIDIAASQNKKVIKFYEMVDHVEKHKGLNIDPYKTSVIKWYYSLKNMSNGKADKGK